MPIGGVVGLERHPRMQLTKQEQFFYDHGGISYNPDTETQDQGHERNARELAAAETWAVVQSLGSCFGDAKYERVVRAELALEQMSEVRKGTVTA